MKMTPYALIWVPLGIFAIIMLSFAVKYSFDRRHYKNNSRRAANNVDNSNTTVVYTIPNSSIPTTGQLNTAYPELSQSQFPNQQNRPPSYVASGEAPPSYDQAISTPANQPVSLVIK